MSSQTAGPQGLADVAEGSTLGSSLRRGNSNGPTTRPVLDPPPPPPTRVTPPLAVLRDPDSLHLTAAVDPGVQARSRERTPARAAVSPKPISEALTPAVIEG
jgi:hypothetical protein